MSAWATVTLTLGVAIITGMLSYLNQRAASRNEDQQLRSGAGYVAQRQMRAEAYVDFRKLILGLSAATDSLIFATRNMAGPVTAADVERVRAAVDRVRQARNRVPLLASYIHQSDDGQRIAAELMQLFRQAAFSLRYHVGDSVAPGEPWSLSEVADRLIPRADRLVEELSTIIVTAIRTQA